MRRCFTCSLRYDDQRLICPADGDALIYEGKPSLETGRVLGGKYKLGNLLGEGGMGRVFEASRIETREIVAIKLLKAELTDARGHDTPAEKRFEVEAEAAAALDHPGVVKVFEFRREADGPSYIAMERLQGSTFDELRRAGKFASVEHVVGLLREVCGILACAHAKGIVHRDLKPSNLYLHRVGPGRSQVKVLDFGIAKILYRAGERLTSTGEFLGTLLYMAPELTGGHPVTTAADVYSLGVILFEALTGRTPFLARHPMEIIRLHASTPAPALLTYRPDVSEELDALVGRCLAKKPEARFTSAAELLQAMEALGSLRADAGGGGDTRTLRANPSNWVGIMIDERYEIHEWIAPGRFGSDVYRASHLHTGAAVAVRLWRIGKGAVRDCLLDAFKGEGKAMGLRHPNLIGILDVGFNDDCVYVVTELIESVSLRTLMGRASGVSRPVAVALIRGAADGLRLLHEKKIVSGGLSPETLRVASGAAGPEKLLLTPFGLSNLKQLSSLFPRGSGTDGGDRSADYISPEQRGGAEPDARSDLYSLGLILFEMLGGKVPEQELPRTMSFVEIRREAGASNPPAEPFSLPPPDLSPAWEAFFQRAIARNPHDRFNSAAELVAALPRD